MDRRPIRGTKRDYGKAIGIASMNDPRVIAASRNMLGPQEHVFKKPYPVDRKPSSVPGPGLMPQPLGISGISFASQGVSGKRKLTLEKPVRGGPIFDNSRSSRVVKRANLNLKKEQSQPNPGNVEVKNEVPRPPSLSASSTYSQQSQFLKKYGEMQQQSQGSAVLNKGQGLLQSAGKREGQSSSASTSSKSTASTALAGGSLNSSSDLKNPNSPLKSYESKSSIPNRISVRSLSPAGFRVAVNQVFQSLQTAVVPFIGPDDTDTDEDEIQEIPKPKSYVPRLFD